MRVPFFLLSLTAALFARTVNAHGFMETPRQRGILERNPFTNPPAILTGLPKDAYDYKCHFPAGDKNDKAGSALDSQKAAAGSAGWTPYKPWRSDFVFRSGPCGDLKDLPEHMRGGRFYQPQNGPPKIVATYEQGGILSATVGIVGHHNGFIEFTVCDVSKCGGEISESCLRNHNSCKRLMREPQEECEVGNNPGCGPMDPNYPTRFYLPCRQRNVDVYGNGLMKYRLPADMACEHCVIQMYWAAANDCNPPGIVQYFKGPRGPNWGDCPGEGDAKGGFRPWNDCGGSKFSEEYYTCADISITPNGQELKEVETKKGDDEVEIIDKNPIDSLGIWIDGELKEEVREGGRAFWKIENKPIAFEARTEHTDLKAVYFYVGPDRKLWREGNKPYVYLGNRGKEFKNWPNPIKEKWFPISITAEDENGNTHFFECELFLR